MIQCNRTEELVGDDAVAHEVPLWKGFTFHHFGLFISAAFGLVACLIAFFVIIQHARFYSKPWEQKHIIRVLFMIPVYAIVSFVSYLFYRYATYWEVIRDCYEAFAIASFFTLLCHYLEPTLHEQKNYFRQLQPRNWVWPLPWFQKCSGGRERGPFRVPRSGLTWFNIIWVGIFQYCAIRVIFTFVALITNFFDRYCDSSLSPAFSHIWVMVFEGAGVSVAMYCIIQFYIQLKGDLAQHRPFMKVLCIKLVIFLSFWQELLISFLSSSSGPLKPTTHIAYADIHVGIPAMLLCIEMALFSILHIFAFSWKPYNINSPANAGDPNMYYRGFFHALLDAFNPWDIIKALARGARWLFVGYKKRETDESYTMKNRQPDDSSFTYDVPTFAGNGEPAAEVGMKARLPHDDRAALLGHAQADPRAGSDPNKLPAYGPGHSYEDGGDLSLAPTLSRDEYGSSYPSSVTAGAYGRDPSPYRYDVPPPIHSPQQMSSGPGSGTSGSPVIVSPVTEQPHGYHTAPAAAHPFAGVNRPGYVDDADYDRVDTGYHGATTAPSAQRSNVQGQGQGSEWDVWSGAGAPPR